MMITLFYHFYVENEIYAMSYKKEVTVLHESLFVSNGMRKWGASITWDEILINNGYLI